MTSDIPEDCMVLWHSTDQVFDRFEAFAIKEGGFHFGTYEQALMRAGRTMLQVSVLTGKSKRLKDRGSWNEKSLARHRRAGFDAVIYLNRFEGIPLERFQALRELGIDLDRIPDSRFRKLVPEAKDSLIVFNPSCISIEMRQPHPGRTQQVTAGVRP
jgi:hypothetical protein